MIHALDVRPARGGGGGRSASIECPPAVPSPRVAELLSQYFRIAFLAGRPQDLPGGQTQMRIGLGLAATTYLLALAGTDGIGDALVHVAIDLGGTALALRLALSMVGHPGRFEQAFGGLCGASAFVNTAAIPVYLSAPPDGTAGVSAGGALAGFALLVWSLSLLAHVLRHTFEIGLGTSIGIAFVWFLLLLSVVGAVLPPEPVPPVDPYALAAPPSVPPSVPERHVVAML